MSGHGSNHPDLAQPDDAYGPQPESCPLCGEPSYGFILCATCQDTEDRNAQEMPTEEEMTRAFTESQRCA